VCHLTKAWIEIIGTFMVQGQMLETTPVDPENEFGTHMHKESIHCKNGRIILV
jgi:hypothetical protein